MGNEVETLLRECDAACRAGKRREYSMARHSLIKCIATAKVS